MSSLTTPAATDPTTILRYRDGLYATDLLAAAISHLDFFTWLGANNGATDSEICTFFSFAPRPVDVMLTLFRANGFIETDEGKHTLTATAREHLVSTSPFFLGAYYDGMKDRPVVLDYLKVFKTDKPANWASLEDQDDWHKAMLEEDFARKFTAAMDCRGLALGQALAATVNIGDRKHLLDIGGGSGIYAATMVAAHEQLTATVFDQSPVDEIAREAVAKHGLSERINVETGNFFTDPWPTADVHLLSNVLHDWGFADVRRILQRSADSLNPGGLLIIHEVFINNEKTGSLPAAEYSALLMQVTQGKCYTPNEYGTLLHELNFTTDPYHETIGDRGFFTTIKN